MSAYKSLFWNRHPLRLPFMTIGFPKPKKKSGRPEGRTFGNKYNNRKETRYGISFASKLEASVYDELKLLESAGQISDLRCQDIVYLTAARIGYRVDFSAHNENTGERWYYEAKGYPTDVWKIKRRLWLQYGPGTLEIWGGTWIKPKVIETIYPKRPCEVCIQAKVYKSSDPECTSGGYDEDNDND